MALPVGTQAKYWGIAAAILFALLWFLANTQIEIAMPDPLGINA